MKNQGRPGQQQYRIHVEPLGVSGEGFYLYPQVYPTSRVSPGGKINWSANPDIHMSLASDIYLYVAGSSYVQYQNEQIAESKEQRKLGEQATMTITADSSDSINIKTITLTQGETVNIGGYNIGLKSFQKININELPGDAILALRATLQVRPPGSNELRSLHPLFAIYKTQGRVRSYSPPQFLQTRDVSVRFTGIEPSAGKVKLKVKGIDKTHEKPWVLVIAQEKPFISLVWIGTLVMMVGFGISIFRHANREHKRQR